MNNDRGGIISNILIVPIGIVLMIGIFFLGYYVGSTRAKAAATGEPLPPLPDMLSQQMPKPEEFTFYKTLTEKDNKTVSIDVKQRPAEPAPQTAKREAIAEVRSKPDIKAELKTVYRAQACAGRGREASLYDPACFLSGKGTG